MEFGALPSSSRRSPTLSPWPLRRQDDRTRLRTQLQEIDARLTASEADQSASATALRETRAQLLEERQAREAAVASARELRSLLDDARSQLATTASSAQTTSQRANELDERVRILSEDLQTARADLAAARESVSKLGTERDVLLRYAHQAEKDARKETGESFQVQDRQPVMASWFV